MYRTITLRILESFFRHRWLNILPLIIMMAASGAYLVVKKADYVSQGMLYINTPSLVKALDINNNNNANLWSSPAQVTTDEINELIATDAFVRAIIQKTDLEEYMTEGPVAVNDLFVAVREEVKVVSLGTNQTQISVTDENPKVAYQLVNSLIDNYIQWKINSQKTDSQATLDFYSNLIEQYKTEVDTARENLKAYISAHPEPIQGDRPFLEQFEIDRLNNQVNLSQDRLTAALTNEESAKLALSQIESNARQTYITIDAPEVAVEPTMSMKSLGLSIGVFLAVGAILSVGLVVLAMMMDKTLRFSLDVSQQLGLPVLAMIPDTAAGPALPVKSNKKLPPAAKQKASKRSKQNGEAVNSPKRTEI